VNAVTPDELAECRRASARAAMRVWRVEASRPPLDDLFAEALAAAVLSLARYDPARGALSHWIGRVTRRACLRYAAWWRRRGMSGFAGTVVTVSDGEYWGQVPARESGGGGECERILAGLPERQRALLLAMYRDGYEPRELSPEFGPTRKAVEQMAVRARKLLRELARSEVAPAPRRPAGGVRLEDLPQPAAAAGAPGEGVVPPAAGGEGDPGVQAEPAE
jgi:DNA-directed RNA polymerase specialized sigma24 family protein